MADGRLGTVVELVFGAPRTLLAFPQVEVRSARKGVEIIREILKKDVGEPEVRRAHVSGDCLFRFCMP